jgi:4-hydroxybenzoate polyprenyltransferase
VDLRTRLGLVRPFTLLAPVVGVACTAVAPSRVLGLPYDVRLVGLAALSAACATGASNAWNQAFDADIDRQNKPERPIPSGRATVAQALRFGHVLAALALVFALMVGFLQPRRPDAAAGAWAYVFVQCVAIGLLSTWIYSAPPLRTKRSTIGALLTIAIPRGFLVPVAGWSVLAAPTTLEPWALGLVPGLFVLGAASTKDFADVEGDRAHGCRTLPVVLGARRAAYVVAPFLVLPFLLYPLLASQGVLWPPTTLWVRLSLVLASLGAFAAWQLLSDPSRLATERNHPAWRAMYLLMLANQLGVAFVYRLL